MTYNAEEISLESGRPIELYEINLGSTQYRWTSYEADVSYGGTDYSATEITREGFAQGPDDRDNILEIVVPSSNALVQQYTNVVPSDAATVRILRAHAGDGANETIVLWKGVVQTVSFFDQNEKAKIACRPEVGTSSRPIPRFTHSGLCNHVLYDGQCQISEGSFRHTDTVSSVSADGKTITVANLSSNGASWAVGGYIAFGNDRRMILSQSGDAVTINLPFGATPSGSVDVQAGCDHTPATCKSKFNNIVNFGGFPYVPNINIFESGIDGSS